jgi:hypothetical protein
VALLWDFGPLVLELRRISLMSTSSTDLLLFGLLGSTHDPVRYLRAPIAGLDRLEGIIPTTS